MSCKRCGSNYVRAGLTNAQFKQHAPCDAPPRVCVSLQHEVSKGGIVVKADVGTALRGRKQASLIKQVQGVERLQPCVVVTDQAVHLQQQ